MVRKGDQAVWTDPATGFRRRSISPPTPEFGLEIIEGQLPPGRAIAYDRAPRPGSAHYLHMLEGGLTVIVGDTAHSLRAGDTLRWKLFGPSRFEAAPPYGARYILAMT